MNWTIPVMDDTPRPAFPRVWPWGGGLLVILVMGFMLAIFILPETELQDKRHLLNVACGGPFLVWLLLFGVRLSAYELTVFRIHARNGALAVRRRQWQRWANQGSCVLISARHTVPEQQGARLIAGGIVPLNQNNRLTFEALEGMLAWTRCASLLSPVLDPVSAYLRQHALPGPVNLYFQCPEGEATLWQEAIEKEAKRLELPLAELQPLDKEGLPGWLLAASDCAPQGPTCLIFTELDGRPEASEEIASLLLASPAFCHAHKLTPASHLPRSLMTPFAHLSEAMVLMFQQQLPAGKIPHVSHTLLPTPQTEKLQLLRAEQMTACPALFDVDSALGHPGCARTAVQLTLAAQSLSPTLLLSMYQGQCWLQQVIPGGDRWSD
ncbi:hypothetical protein EDF81_4457 [Enterobacter sp. BIGb0383]|uniref:hypothetical protein n=1 Tax=unclassified Enterobacter TaxID=2608935 RepID=UPI000FBB8E0C|nr:MULTISPECIES: hypothetical protein [unclassified Enterobacter]ROP49445.1 hypothetical protein EDF81_4457 [Enterobacter sp. BIGb0383]ROS00679.1 hypothetical protein EC848_4371 [Enterobacter sp. BIGb0359]